MTANEENGQLDRQPTADFSLAAFSTCISSMFSIRLQDGRQCQLELVEAVPLKYYAGAPRKDPFSLLFRSHDNIVLPQDTYDLEHTDLGGFPLFLIPKMPDQDSSYFEAIFN